MRDADRNATWHDLEHGRQLDLGPTPARQIVFATYQRDLGLLAYGGGWDAIHVVDVDSGERWFLPVSGKGQLLLYDGTFDPQGRWLLTVCATDGRALLWPLPLDPMLGELEHDELLARLRSMTNVRMVRDDADPRTFRITTAAPR